MAVNPIDNPDLYDSILLGTVRSPGVVKISDHALEDIWDVKEAKGSAGASTTHQGIKVNAFSCSFFLADTDEIEAWASFLPEIMSLIDGASIQARDIYHPDLAELNIRSVSRSKISGRVHDGKGGQTIAVRFQQYLPPKPKGGAPAGSTDKDYKNSPADPNAQAKAELQKALAEAKQA